jgi:hypothetical protein
VQSELVILATWKFMKIQPVPILRESYVRIFFEFWSVNETCVYVNTMWSRGYRDFESPEYYHNKQPSLPKDPRDTSSVPIYGRPGQAQHDRELIGVARITVR